MKTKRKTTFILVKKALYALEINESIDRVALAKEIWGDSTYITRGLLNVQLPNAKKELHSKEFKSLEKYNLTKVA